MKNKKKTSLVALLLVGILGIVGGTIAYFTSADTFTNVFTAGTYKIEVVDTFTSPTDWTPGTETTKSVIATNKGSVPAAVRVSIVSEEWTPAPGVADRLGLTDGANDSEGNRAALINKADDFGDNWIESGDYYYYKRAIDTDDSTSSPIKSVTFNPAINIVTESTCTDATPTTGSRTCTTTAKGFAGATYTLKFKVETVQFDQYKALWTDAPTLPAV